MKSFLKAFFLLLVIAAAGGLMWWQQNKKKIIKDAIQNSIRNKTDSLYTIRYDSSSIDELNGNASFYNISMQSESAQKELLARTDSLPDMLFFIKVKEIRAEGVDIPGILQNNNVSAKTILIDKPIIQIMHIGAGRSKPFTSADTLELYQRILGKFKSIKADNIQVSNGQVIITDRNGQSLTTLENININLKNFLVDSTRSYRNIVSYFIKDVAVSVENIQLPESKNNTRINITKLRYDATAKTLLAGQVLQYKTGNTKPEIELNKISITKLNTDSFILNQQLKAGVINCEGGLITIYKRKKARRVSTDSIEFSTDFVGAQIDSMSLGKTKLVIIDETVPGAGKFILNDMTFRMTKGLKLFDGNTLTDIIRYADWKLSSSGFSVFTKDKLYRIDANGLAIDNVSAGISLDRLSIVPLLSEPEFVRQSTHQRDRYEMSFTNIKLQDVDFQKLVNNNVLEVNNASLQAVLKISNDRTVPVDLAGKVGKAPYQQLMKLKMPVYINRLLLNNSLVTYTERGEISRRTGTVSFTNVNAVISNITNIPERIRQNGTMKITVNTRFMGNAALNTMMLLPLTAENGNFTVTGKLQSLYAPGLNPLIEPLGMVSVKSGTVSSTEFALTGNDYKATCNLLMTYKDLKVEVLKIGEDNALKKRTVTSFLANAVINNDNPSRGALPRRNIIENDRELNKSFFNLLWKSILKAVKKTTSGKKT